MEGPTSTADAIEPLLPAPVRTSDPSQWRVGGQDSVRTRREARRMARA